MEPKSAKSILEKVSNIQKIDPAVKPNIEPLTKKSVNFVLDRQSQQESGNRNQLEFIASQDHRETVIQDDTNRINLFDEPMEVDKVKKPAPSRP